LKLNLLQQLIFEQIIYKIICPSVSTPRVE